ncbi:histidinol-phosphate transaminase [Caldibacillus lycopersici]|uniref:Histidinol-phosphate aminotransferase n=1 Tax=Perspicuibacillus lycopersici TaxID=1325689 RepID=A0AAE3LML0_9BACI|nr:histidinol-phosphate transaminase [Perspicuibacillus lycopersici]MCU9613705.1 histidinol-phosphate transaminase [Perspicuibacillus lycopersici]
MKWKEQILNLHAYQPGKSIDAIKREYGLERIVKLASNENPYGCSNKVTEMLNNQTTSNALYPDGYAFDLRMSLATHFQVQPSELIFGNGSDELIQIINSALIKPGTNAVMATPTFSEYQQYTIINGGEAREILLTDKGEHNFTEMLNVIDENTAIVWICNPNNPSGVYMKEEELVAFLEKIPNDILVVIDEAYNEYVVANDYPNTLKLLKRFKNIIMLRTFSKIYGLASFRIGYGVADPSIIKTLEPIRSPFNTNTFAQKAALAALADQEFLEQCKRKNREELEKMYQFLENVGLSYYPTQGNFLLVDFQTDGDQIFQKLLQQGFIVRSGKSLGFPNSVRITIGQAEDMEALRKAIQLILTTV